MNRGEYDCSLWFRTFSSLILLFLALLLSTPLHAQATGAQLTGTVKDPSGAVIPNARVTALNTATNVATSTTSNTSGAYSIANLDPGDYTVTATATGFTTTKTSLTLTVGATQLANFTMTIGQQQQTVTVTSAAATVDLSSPTISGEVSQSQVETLPLNGRDWSSLAELQPGVEKNRVHEAVTQPGGDLRGLGTQESINGNRSTQNVYRLDGLIVNDYSNAGPGNVLGANTGVDAIQEFSVLTTNYSAQYGFTSGGVINAVTKSGTNQWHGSGYEFLRNSYFDAPNYFENLSKLQKGNFVRNQFGASMGGAIVPSKLFIFGNYEGIRQSQAIPSRTNVLTPNARKGIFYDANGNILGPNGSATYKNSSGTTQTWGPWTGACPYPNMTNMAPGVAGFCVDNTESQLINSLMRLPTAGIPLVNANVGRYVFDAKQIVSGNFETLRLDYNISPSDHADLTWYQDHSVWEKPDAQNASLSGFTVPHFAYSFEETHVFSPSLVNVVRLGVSESDLGSPSIGVIKGTPLAAGLVDTSFSILPGQPLTAPGTSRLAGGGGAAGLGGFGGFNPGGGFFEGQGLIQAYDDVDKTVGNHDFKLGFMYIRNWDDFITGPGGGNGSVSYSSAITQLQNIPAQIRMPNRPPVTIEPAWHNFETNIFAGYLTDTYRMTPRLTWDLGVRYEMNTIPVEVSPPFFSIPFLYTNPSSCQTPTPAGCPGFRTKVFESNPTTNDWMPRVGFAWDPFGSGKTSVRGGVGMFDVLPLPYELGLNTLQTAPSGTEVDLNCNNLDAGTLATIGQPGAPVPACQGIFPKGILPLEQSFGTSPPKRINYVEPNPGLNYTLQWNFNVQRQISPNLSITAAYLGSRGIHNPFQTDELNTVFPYKTQYGYLFPTYVNSSNAQVGGAGCLVSPSYPNNPCSQTDINLGLPPDFSTNPTAIVPGLLINPYTALIQSTVWQAQSWYRAMTLSVVRKMSHGLYVQGSFTWQRSLDTSSSSFAGDNYASNVTPTIPWWDLSLTKGPSDFNVGRSLVINALWDIPTKSSVSGLLSEAVKGWEVGGILTLSDGVPLWPIDGVEGDPMGQLNGEPMALPQLVPGCKIANPGAVQYLNPDCFINQQAPNLDFYNAGPPYGCDHSFAYPTCINLLGTGPATVKRNQIVGPGEYNVDFSLLKNFPISERVNLQFQANAFNLFNHVNFAPPAAGDLEPLGADGAPVGGFGQITNTETPNRELQFALKLLF